MRFKSIQNVTLKNRIAAKYCEQFIKQLDTPISNWQFVGFSRYQNQFIYYRQTFFFNISDPTRGVMMKKKKKKKEKKYL